MTGGATTARVPRTGRTRMRYTACCSPFKDTIFASATRMLGPFGSVGQGVVRMNKSLLRRRDRSMVSGIVFRCRARPYEDERAWSRYRMTRVCPVRFFFLPLRFFHARHVFPHFAHCLLRPPKRRTDPPQQRDFSCNFFIHGKSDRKYRIRPLFMWTISSSHQPNFCG